MNHILILTDFSQNVWNATRYALNFFEGKKCTFHFLHIDISRQDKTDEETHYTGLHAKKEISESIKLEMKEWMQRVYTFYPNPRHIFKEVVLQTFFIEGIRGYVEKNKIEFIVMGAKGVSELKGKTIGSKTGAVITRVKCSILVIPEATHYEKPVNIGFPTDFNMLYKHSVIDTLLEVARIHQSSIKVLRVAQSLQPLNNFQKGNRDLLQHQFNGVPHSFHVIEDPNLEHALQSFVSTLQIDMIAMIAKNLNFFQRLFFTPHETEDSTSIKIPFLLLHE